MGILIMLKEGKTSTVLESAAVISDSFVKSFPDSFKSDSDFDGRFGIQVVGVGMFGE
tara:strand:+ start:9938 stop:10108 length:171 start_codon:yes stop_codon:yes gene_type:complete